MEYLITDHDYFNTGGNCMVSVFTVYVPSQYRTLYVNIGEEYLTVSSLDVVRSDFYDQMSDEMQRQVTIVDGYSYIEQLPHSEYEDLMRQTIMLHLRKDCSDGYPQEIHMSWLPTVYNQFITTLQYADVDAEYSGMVRTDGNRVEFPSSEGYVTTIKFVADDDPLLKMWHKD